MKSILKNSYRRFNRNYQSEYLLKREYTYFSNAKKILDLGCGEGDFVNLDPKRIIGVDSNKRSIFFCKKRKLTAIVASVTKLPFHKDSFDGVHCSHVIEHLKPQDAHEMLSEISRVLKKNGIFVLSTPILWNGFYNDLTHVKPYNPESILRYLANDGQERTLGNISGRFAKIDLYWRFRPINLPGSLGYLISNYLYQFGFHSLNRDAYTLVLKKL